MSDLRRLLFANQTRAYEGYPLVISRSVALRYLKQYQIYGNSEQDGTPTPANPVEVISVGDRIIPAEYQKLEYIGFNGRTAIATGVPAQETDRVIFEANINVDQGTGDKYLTYATNTWVDIAGKASSWYVRFGSESSSSFDIFTGETGQKNTYEVYKNNFDINGVSRATPSYSAISGDWEIGKVGNNCASGNYYRYTIKNNTTGEIRFNGIPAKRLSDSVVGMYDTVSKSFFTTTGTDTFTAGPEASNYVIPVDAQGKNLYNPATMFSLTSMAINNGVVYWGYGSGGKAIKVPCKPNTTYTLTYNGGNRCFIGGFTNDVPLEPDSRIACDFYIFIGASSRVSPKTFTTPSNCYYVCCGLANSVGGGVTNIQLEEGSVATPYAPYGHSITPIYLNAPLRKVGTYADVLDYKKGQIIRNVGVKVLDGTESWARDNTDIYMNKSTLFGYDIPRNALFYMTHFKNTYDINGFSIGTVTFYMKNTGWDTVQVFKDFLASEYAKGTPVIAYYPLATPVTESIVAPALPTMAGSTTYTTETEVKPSNMKGVF